MPNGIPGIETRLPILFSEGVRRDGSPSTVRGTDRHQPRKALRPLPAKGSIGVGFDADITLWDPNRREIIRQENLHHGADYTPGRDSRSPAGR